MKFMAILLLFSVIEIQSFYSPPRTSQYARRNQPLLVDNPEDQGSNPTPALSYVDYTPIKTSLIQHILGKLLHLKVSMRLKNALNELENISAVTESPENYDI